MDAAEALAYIVARLHPDADPALTAVEVAELLALAAGPDTNDLTPADATWTPTYTVAGCYRALAEGWLMKHGKAVGRIDFTTDGQMFKRSQTLDQIEHQRRYWARKVQVSPSTLGATA